MKIYKIYKIYYEKPDGELEFTLVFEKGAIIAARKLRECGYKVLKIEDYTKENKFDREILYNVLINSEKFTATQIRCIMKTIDENCSLIEDKFTSPTETND